MFKLFGSRDERSEDGLRDWRCRSEDGSRSVECSEMKPKASSHDPCNDMKKLRIGGSASAEMKHQDERDSFRGDLSQVDDASTYASVDSPCAKIRQLKLWNAKANNEKREGETYQKDILDTLRAEERSQGNSWSKYKPGVDRDAFIAARVAVIEILSEFSVRYKLKTKTFEAAVLLFDRTISATNLPRYVKVPPTMFNTAPGKHSLYSVGLALLFLQAKFEEIYPPPLSAFVKWCQNDVDGLEISTLEQLLLLDLGWNLSTTTATDFTGWYFEAVDADKKTQNLTMLILESSYRVKLADQVHGQANRKWDFFNKNRKVKVFPRCELMESSPSKLAVACVALSLAYQGKICFPSSLAKISGYNSAGISILLRELHDQLKAEVSDNSAKPSPVIRKFSMRRYQQIGTFRPPSWLEMVQHNAFRETEISLASREKMIRRVI